jgi:hypothetical protein
MATPRIKIKNPIEIKFVAFRPRPSAFFLPLRRLRALNLATLISLFP